MILKSFRSDTARSPEAAARGQRVIRFPEVNRRAGLSKTTTWRGVRDGWFPKPIELSPGCVGWIEHEVDDYIADRVAARDGVHLTNGEQQSHSEQEREKEEAREPVAARASGAGIRRNKLRIGLRAPPDDRRRSAGLAAPRRGDRYDDTKP